MEDVTIVGDESAPRFCIGPDVAVGDLVASGYELKGRDAAGNPEIGPVEVIEPIVESTGTPLEIKLPVPKAAGNLIHFPLGPADVDSLQGWMAQGTVTHEDGQSRQVGPSDFLVCDGKLILIVNASSGGGTFRGECDYAPVENVTVP